MIRNPIILSIAFSSLLAPALYAAPVTWITSPVTGPSDVRTDGILVGALNVGGQGSVQTVNGVTFAADPGGPGAIPMGSATAAFSFDDSFDNDFWAGSSPGGSSAYHSALDSGRSTDVTRSGTVTLGGLVIGRAYQVQVWIADTRTSPYVLGTRVRTVDGVATTAGGPNIATGTFTADGATQVITIAGTTGDSITPHGPQLNMLQLREPASVPVPVNIVVTTAADSGPGSLRAAIAAADGSPGPNSITFSSVLRGQTIPVGATSLSISDPGGLDVDCERVMLERATAATDPMFFVNGGTLKLRNAHLRGGGPAVENGGAVRVAPGATLEVTASTLSGHRAAYGSGITNEGTARLYSCTLTGNSANEYGGAIYNNGAAGTLELTHCTLMENAANGTTQTNDGGGAIDNYDSATLRLTNCILARNTAASGKGPDLWMEAGSLTARHNFIGNGTNSTIVHGTDGNRVGTGAAPLQPLLAPLDYYSTRGRNLPPVMPPLPGSPVIGLAPVVPGSETEQGGSPRGLGLWTNDFFTGLGGAVARGGGTVSGAGTSLAGFRLTLELPDQSGSLILPVIPGMDGGFLATFDYIFNAASGPADGFSFCWGQDPGYNINDAGDGVAHVVRFDIYNGGNGDTGRISYRRNGAEVGAANTTALHRFNDKGRYLPVSVRLFPGGRLIVTFKGTLVIDVETGYAHTTGDRIMFGSRTGGLKALQELDNIGVRTGPIGSQDLGAAQTLATSNPVVGRGDDGDFYEYTRAGDGSVRGFTLRQAMRWAWPLANITFDPVLNGSGVALSREIGLADSPVSTVAVDASSLPGGFTLDGRGANRIFRLPDNRSLHLKALTLTGGRAGGTTVPDEGWGGAIYSYGNLTLTRCTLSGNTSYRGGGALFNGNIAVLQRCTIALNSTTLSNSAQGAEGGAIRNAGYLRVDHCTIAQNGSGTGAIFNAAAGSVTCSNSLLWNTDFGGWNVRNLGSFAFDDGNLATGSVNNSGTVNGAPTRTTPVNLAPLGNYGGPTRTMALRPGSAAINAALSSSGPDQRGFPLVGAGDLGACEAGTHTNCNAWLWETLPATIAGELITAGADIDGDGATNEQEWNARTDPNNAASVLRISSITRIGANLEITFPTVSGRNYTLWQSNDLGAPGSPWTSVQPSAISGVVGRMSFAIPAPVAGTPKRFYRVQAGP